MFTITVSRQVQATHNATCWCGGNAAPHIYAKDGKTYACREHVTLTENRLTVEQCISQSYHKHVASPDTSAIAERATLPRAGCVN